MCGIYGCITRKDAKLSTQEQDKRNAVLRGLSVAMQKRGKDSTGIAGITDDKVSIYKKAISATEFVDTRGFNAVLKKNHDIVIGHTRFATIGDINDKNSHPFKFGNIVGVHNGHVSNYYNINTDIEVDSEAIFYLLEKYNNDYKQAFEELYGDFAIAWFDTNRPNRLFLVSEDNPISLIYIHEIKTYFFASEQFPLEAIIGTHFNMTKHKSWTPEKSKVYTIDTKMQVKKEAVKFKTYSSYYDSDYYHRSRHNEEHPNYQEPYIENHNTYESRYGVSNPYKPEDDGITTLEKIEDLTYQDSCTIVKLAKEEGCKYCNTKPDIFLDEGFYFYSFATTQYIVCNDCVLAGQMKSSYLIKIDADDYEAIIEEINEFELYIKREAKASRRKRLARN